MWLGFGLGPKVVIIALVCFFPIVVTTLDALRSVDADTLKLLRTMDATRWQAFRFAELPAAAPAALSGAKIAVAVSVIGAVFAEYAGLGAPGLGHLILQAIPQLQTAARLRRRRDPRRARRRPLLPARRRRAVRLNPRTRRYALVTPRRIAARRPRAARRARARRVRRAQGADGLHRGAEAASTFLLDYLPNADHAGLYAAQGEGHFERAGLDVDLADAAATRRPPLKLLAAGRADLAISYEPDLLLAREKGAQGHGRRRARRSSPLTSLMSLGKDAITDPRQLRGKRVGTAGIPYQDGLPRDDPRGGRRPEDDGEAGQRRLQPRPRDALRASVDATLGAFWNVEGVELERRNRKPEILHLEDLGVPTYDELVIVAREETVRHDGADDPPLPAGAREGAPARSPTPGRPASTRSSRRTPTSTAPIQEAQLKATLPVCSPEADKPYGWMEPAEWDAFARWMEEQGQLDNADVVQRALTNEFLPGEGI